jgi:hypothetical protein
MQNQLTNQKKIFALSVITAIATVFFSFMGAPFLRVLSASSKRSVFWGLGIVMVCALIFAKAQLAAISIGSIWMTLGVYTEMEKRGTEWRKNILFSILSGFAFAFLVAASVFKGLSTPLAQAAFQEISAPLLEALQKLFPENNFVVEMFYPYLPAVIFTSLMIGLAAGLAFEAQIFRVFQLRRERIASGLRWLDFKLPDLFVWMSMFGFLFTAVDVGSEMLKVIAINISIVAVVAYFIQGIIVYEFVSRLLRIGIISKMLTYLFIFLWLAPAFALIGLADYWMDIRTKMTIKTTVSKKQE